MTTAADLAREIADIRRRLAAVERSSQLGRSSIDSGTLAVNDDSGQQVLTVGKQADGSFAVTGTNGGQVVANNLDLPAGAITETDIADDSISTPKLRANSVTADNIAAGAVTVDKVAANAVTTDKIAANAITADKVAANAITADKIAANAITADKLTADAIDGKTIHSATILIDDIPGGGSVGIDGESGTISLVGTTGKKLTLAPSGILPQIEFYSQDGTNKAFINQPASVAAHASLGINSGGYSPGDHVGRTMRLWLDSQSDLGKLEVIRQADQIRMGGYVWFRSDQLLLGYYNDATGKDSFLWFTNDGTATITATVVVSNTVVASKGGSAETWQTPSLGSPWTNFGSGQQTARYRLMPDGTVLLDGDVKTTGSVSSGATIFTVPTAYRPAANHTFSVTGAGIPAGATLNVLSTGAVTLTNLGGTATVGLLGLSGIRWPVASL